ncbi:hypothetical protein Tco_0413482 [Tanacetum coccineum]
MTCTRGCSKHGGIDQGEDFLKGDAQKDSSRSTEKVSDSSGVMANVLGTLEAANILASRGLKSTLTTASPLVTPVSATVAPASATVSPVVATASQRDPTAAVSTSTSITTPCSRRTKDSKGIILESSQPSHTTSTPTFSTKGKGKEKMIESTSTKKKKTREQLDAQVAKELAEEFAQEEQMLKEQAERDSEVARIQAEEELRLMIDELDRSSEVVNKHMAEYEQAEQDLSLEEKTELINELIKYQKDLAQIKKYQAQQSKLDTKSERRKFYMSVLRSHAGWKTKDFKGMNFEQIEEKFIPVWEKMQDFIPMDSKQESERFKRPGIPLNQRISKRLKTAKASGSEPSQEQQAKDLKYLSEEELKLGSHTEAYQLFKDMLKKFDREDLDQLWNLVKKAFSSTDPTEDKEKMLWVELKRLYEPDVKDQLWALQKYMHDPLEWKFYDTCGVHHVFTIRGHEIFMLVEKDYPLTKGLSTMTISNKLQVDQYSEMANELIVKIYIIANSPR